MKTKAKPTTCLFERLRLSAKGMREKILNAITLAGRLISDIRGEWKIPDDVIKDLARLFFPSVLKMYETEEGRAKLIAWTEESNDNCSGGTDRKDGKRDGATAGGKE